MSAKCGLGITLIFLTIIALAHYLHDTTRPNFIKVGHRYKIVTTAQHQHEDLNQDYTILDYGGGEWFKVSYDTVPENDKTEQTKWLNFAQFDEVIED